MPLRSQPRPPAYAQQPLSDPAPRPDRAAAAAGSEPGRLAFLDGQASDGGDPQLLRQHLEQLGLSCSGLAAVPHQSPFRLRANLVRCGDLTLLASAHTALAIRLYCEVDSLLVVVPYGGQAELSCRGETVSLWSGSGPALLPSGSVAIHSDAFNSVILRANRLRLQLSLESLLGSDGSSLSLAEISHSPTLFTADDPLQAELVQQLQRALQLLDAPHLLRAGLLASLALDELIYRILAALVANTSPGPLPLIDLAIGSDQAAVRDQIIEDLIAWIQANLHRPLSLAALEERTAYSRRSLQYAFKRRFGCSPMHWIRQQRLHQALRQLQHPERDTSVRKVAQACGYSHLSGFGRDFRNQFNRRASDVLRQARQQQRPAPDC